MNKIFKIALILAVVIAILIGGASIYLAKNGQKILNQNKDVLTAQISKILKTPVELGELKLKVFPNAIVNIDKLIIGKTANTSGITVNSINLDVAILELLKKRLVITELVISNPSVKIIKSKSGIAIAGLPMPTKAGDEKNLQKENPEAKQASESKPTQIPGGIEIALEKFLIDSATIEFEDQVLNKKFLVQPLSVGAAVQLEGSTASLLGLNINSEISGITKLAVTSEQINFDLKEQNLNLPNLLAEVLGANFKISSDFNLKSFTGDTKLSGTNLNLSNVANALTPFTPALKAMDLSGNVSPEFLVKLAGLKNIDLNGTVKLSEIAAKVGPLLIKQLGGDIKLKASLAKQSASADSINLLVGSAPVNLSFEANLAGNEANLKNQTNLFGGTANLSAKNNLKNKDFSTNLTLASLNLGDAYQALPLPILEFFSGTLNKMNLDATGNVGANLISSINAKGNLLLTNGSLKGTNLPAKVLGVIKDLPFIAGSLLDVVPDNLRGEITGEDTAIRELTSDFGLNNSTIKINSLKLISTIFELQANGNIGLDKKLDLQAEIIFNQAFSQALATKTKEISRILNSQGQLVVPIKITGDAKKIIIIPNLKKLLEMAATNAVKDKIAEKIEGKIGESGKNLLNKFGF